MASQGVALPLQFSQVASSLRRHGLRNPRQRGHLQAITLAGRSFLDGVQKYQPIAVLNGFDMNVDHAGRLARQTGEFEIMRGKQGKGVDFRGDEGRASPSSDRPSKVLVPRPTSSMSTRL